MSALRSLASFFRRQPVEEDEATQPAMGAVVLVAVGGAPPRPGVVSRVVPGQYLVSMPNGRQVWIDVTGDA